MKIALLLCLGLLVLGNAPNVYAQDETSEAVSSSTVASTLASSEESSSTLADVTSTASSGTTKAESEATTEGSGSTNSDESTSSVSVGSTEDSSSTDAPTESSSAASSEASTLASSEASSEASTEASTKASTKASTEASTVSTTTSKAVCLSDSEMWGDEDIRYFYFCEDNEVLEDECDKGYYYVNNATVSGCIPGADMNPNCVNLDATAPECEGENLKQPQVCETLTNFYLCPKEGASATELTCTEDKAFANQDGYLGCFTWAEWRKVRDCPQ